MNETVKVNKPDIESAEQAVIQDNKASLFPTQMIELPSKGLVYPTDSPFSSGLVEIKYMTTKEEDILTTESYIKNNIVYDKLLQSLIVNPLMIRQYDQLLVGDRNALIVAARLYGHGEIYDIEVDTPSGNKQKVSVDLNDLKPKELTNLDLYKHQNQFFFKTPFGKNNIEFRLMTVGADKAVTAKLKNYKTASGRDTQLSDRLKAMIISVDGNDDPNFVNLFVEGMLARDVKEFRKYIAEIQPNINMEIEVVDEATGEPFPHSVTLDSSFFWSNT